MNKSIPNIKKRIKEFEEKWEQQFRGSDIQYADKMIMEWLTQALSDTYQEGFADGQQVFKDGTP